MKSSICVMMVCVLVTACNRTAGTGVALQDAAVLLYEEQEAGTDSYPVRILVNRDFVRLDDGFDASDYVLFDRRSRTVFSVTREERRILAIDHHPVAASLPAEINFSVRRDADAAAPAIGGGQPVHMQFKANNSVCLEAVVVPGLLDEVTAALAEYADTLGDRQLNAMRTVPEEMRTACFLVRYAYRPGAHFREGLPVREWDGGGYRRSLRDFREHETVAASLFTLPPGYEEVRIR